MQPDSTFTANCCGMMKGPFGSDILSRAGFVCAGLSGRSSANGIHLRWYLSVNISLD